MMNSSQVDSRDGSPALYIDGKKTPPIVFGLSDIPGSATNTVYAQRNIANFAAQGIHLVMIDTELRLGWHKLSPFEWEPLQEEIAAAMQADPEINVIIRLHVNPPYWWLRDNPDELVIYKDQPGVDDGDYLRLIRGDMEYHMRASLASRKWLEEAGECLKQFCQNVWDTPEGRAVLGIQVACGINGEWHQWGVDCSKPMKERFSRFLHEKYETDRALQEAWGNPDVTLATAHFHPDPDQPGDDGIFRDPIRSRDIMDAQYCIQMVVPEAILHFCKIIRKYWGRPVLAGAFYGYYLGTYGSFAPIGGHLLPQMLYEKREYVDFLSGPCPYLQNRLPECIPMQRGMLESNRLRNVLWLTEMDEAPVDTQNYVGGDPARINETIAQLRRNVLIPVMAGQGLWYYDHRVICEGEHLNIYCGSIFRKTGWWETPDLLEQIKMLQRLIQNYALRPYQSAADVLFVYDTNSNFITSRYVDEEYETLEAVCRAGAVYDSIYLSELEVAQLERYRCIIFVNSYALSGEQREMIRRCTEGKQTVWLYAAGFADETHLGEENIKDLTGMAVCRIEPEEEYRVLECGEKISLDPSQFTPMFAIDDSDAQPLAVYSRSGACAVARKGDSWYFAVPRMDKVNARRFLQAAGAHLYCASGDPVFAGAGMVAINTAAGGEREIVLRNGKRIRCTLPPYTTAIFDAQSGERLDG